VTPYLAFIPAQFIHGSGVLSVVVAGLYLGYRAPAVQSAEARIAESINWRTIQFLLENAVFLFMGLALSSVVREVLKTGLSVGYVVLVSAVVLITLIIARVVWMITVTALYHSGPQRLRERSWSWRTSVAVSFAGMRGVVTLAAAFLLPAETPHRAFLQFLAFVVVLGTLLEGLALPWIIRRLRLPAPNLAQETSEMRRLQVEAQTAGLARLEEEASETEDERVVGRLRADAVFLAEALENPETGEGDDAPRAYLRLRKGMIEAEREAVLAARAEGRYEEPAVRAVLALLDAEEAALRSSTPRKPGSQLT
jgi:CPA1 family monovalent cation:H+ antiporter